MVIPLPAEPRDEKPSTVPVSLTRGDVFSYREQARARMRPLCANPNGRRCSRLVVRPLEVKVILQVRIGFAGCLAILLGALCPGVAAVAATEDGGEERTSLFTGRYLGSQRGAMDAVEALVQEQSAAISRANARELLLGLPREGGQSHRLLRSKALLAPGAVSDVASTKGRRFVVGDGWDTTGKIATGIVAAGAIALFIDGDEETIRDVGDVTAIFPPAVGLTFTFVGHDHWQGTWQWTKLGLVSTATTHLLKETAQKVRPDASDAVSFPSGHTQASFFGAQFIQRRYGPRWGVPAYVMAAYTGLSRVYGQKHFMDDVISGMSISLLSGWYLVHPVESRVALMPLSVPDGYGIAVTLPNLGRKVQPVAQESPKKAPPRKDLRWRYDWEFGGAWVDRNDVRAPSDEGDQFSMLFQEKNNPTTTARIGLSWDFAPRHRIAGMIAPFEVREDAVFEEDVSWRGVLIPEGTELVSRYLFYEYRLSYSYDLLPESKVRARVGAALSVQDSSISLATPDLEDVRETFELDYMPLVHLHLGYAFTPRWILFAEADLVSFSGDSFLDALIELRFRINDRWDVGLGGRRIEREFENAVYYNDISRDQASLSFAYSF